MNDTLDRIRARAYELWNEAGRPEGQAEWHWLTAEREVLATAMAQPSATAAAARPRSRRVPAATPKSKRSAAG